MSTKDNADYLMQAAKEAGVTDPTELANFMARYRSNPAVSHA